MKTLSIVVSGFCRPILLGILVVLWSTDTTAQSSDGEVNHHQGQRRNIASGVEIGYGLTNFVGRNQSGGVLARPTVSLLLLHRLDTKNQLSYKVRYRSFGNTFFAGQGERKAYSQIDFIGLSTTYQRKIIPHKPIYLGGGVGAERLLKDQTVVILQDGTRFSNPSIQTYRNVNWSGHVLGSYHISLSNRITTTLGLEYNFGIVNFLKPIATQKSGRTLYTNGLFLHIGILI